MSVTASCVAIHVHVMRRESDGLARHDRWIGGEGPAAIL
jgi:hypothetical protein